MASTDLETKPAAKSLNTNAVDTLADCVKKIAIPSEDDSESSEPSNETPRPFFSYTRPQIMHLYKSPLVQSPEGMPELKDWFGDWNEQYSSKKDPDASATTAGGRDRRFKRDPEDTESTTARPSFRATLTQPSQMGNFRHQSTRTNDREKDTDKEKDRDRDTKDGLRSLSDKYDRDRLGLTSGSVPIRPRERERDAAPHLAATAASRVTATAALPAGSRRAAAEPRDPGKRRIVESSDDWRRGAEPPRRDEKSDTYRRDREARERPRSRSRTRRDASTTRRDRDDKDKDRGERPARGTDHYSPTRDKDEDARRWRDDGKRDERLAARRDRDRDNDRDAPNDKGRDRDRWHTTEDRDTRSKRPTAKDRRYADDGKDKDDHKEREKEKEPAWMETYVPNDAHAGILGGQAAEGEMDSIQAWKKSMKEKEEKEKQSVATEKKGSNSENPMDEIQMFKMLIKREADKKDVDRDTPPAASPIPPSGSLNGKSQPSGTNAIDDISVPKTGLSTAHSNLAPPASEAPRSLLSLITSPAGEPATSAVRLSAPALESQTSSGSRFFPKPIHGEKPPNDRISPSPASEYLPPQSSRLLALGSRTPSGSSVHPSNSQAGLTPRNASPGLPQPSLQQLHALHAQSELQSHSPDLQYRLRSESPFGANQRPGPGRQQEQFLPFEHGGRGIPYDEKDIYAQQYEGHRRASGMSNMSSDSGSYGDPNGGFMGNGGQPSPLDLSGGNQSGSFTNGKGSRFAKFFDNKGRDPQMATITKPGGHGSPSPLQAHRQDINRAILEQQGGDNRAMEDLFAMLQSSSQGPRINQAAQAQLNQMAMLGGNSYGQGLSAQHQQAQHHGAHMPSNGRLDALYDSRFEDKSFVPDGMVPGLRTAPPTRSREASNGYIPDHLEEQMPFAMNRQPPQHRNGEMFNNNVSQVYPHQQGFARNGPIQQAPYRGNPSPNPSQNPLQRLPPGLANLGGRPPHDSSQFFGNNIPLQSPQGIHNNAPSPQSFNNYPAGGLPFAAAPQMRVPSGQGHMQNVIGHNPLGGGLGQHPNAIDLRAANQAQLLGLRGGGGGGYTPQQLAHAQMQAQQQLSLRQQQQQQQQQQQHLPQNMVHHLPHHLQQPPGVPGGHNQPAQDLMALLMGNSGPHLE